MNKIKHINANTIEAAVAALGPTANVIAGGTDLYGTLKSMCLPKPPETIINIKTIPGLDYIKEEGGVLKIGTLAKLADIAESSVVQSKWSSLAESAHKVASPAIRNMGTIGGNVCQMSRCWYFRAEHNAFSCLRKGGDTCFGIAGDNRYLAIIGGQLCFHVCPSDTAIALAALNATAVTTQRSIPMREFYIVLGNVLKDNEIIKEFQVPSPAAGTKQVFLKYAARKAIDFASSSVAAVVTSASGSVTNASIVLGGIAPLPYRATTAEDLLKGKPINADNATAVAEEAMKRAKAQSGNRYLIQITKTLIKRAILAVA